MKTQVIILSVILISLNSLFSQEQLTYFSELDTIVIQNNSFLISGDLSGNEIVSARLIDNAKKGRIYFNSHVVLTDAKLNVIDQDGSAWLSHSFAVLSDLDISVKRLPEGRYELLVSSDQGQRSIAFER